MKNTQNYYHELKEIIDTEDWDRFMEYLKNIPKEDFHKIKELAVYNSNHSLRKHYNQTLHIDGYNRKLVGSPNQILMTNLIFLATATEKELINNSYFNDFYLKKENGQYLPNFDDKFIKILKNRKGGWIKKCLRREFNIPPYTTLIKLMEQKILTYDKRIFSISLGELITLPIYIKQFQTYEYIKNNKFLIENDLLSFFDTGVYFFYITSNPRIEIHWPEIFKKLTQENILSRDILLFKCIESSKKNFHKNLTTQYRELFTYLNPTIEEKIRLQKEIFELFHHSSPANIKFALEQIQSIIGHERFDKHYFLLNCESVLSRNDTKTSIKIALSIFEKIAKKDAGLSSQICQLATICLISSDISIQEKAAKIIKFYGNNNDDSLLESLQIYSQQIPISILDYLQDFLFSNRITHAQEVNNYQYIKKEFPKTITDEQPIEYISNWNDLLFQFGKAFKSKEPIEVELLLDGIIRLRGQFPLHYKEQLEPFLKQVIDLSWNSRTRNILRKFIKNWLNPPSDGLHEELLESYSFDDIFIELYFSRLSYIFHKIKQNSALPLLSTPTHTPFWVSIETLVDKLLVYQQYKEPLNILDLSLAIARIIFTNSESLIKKINQLNLPLRDILLYLLNINKQINHLPLYNTVSQENFIHFTNFHSQLESSEEVKATTLWAIVARTKYPDGTFNEFSNSILNQYPNIINTYPLSWEAKEVIEEETFLGKTITSVENRLILKYYNNEIPIKTLIYSLSYSSKNHKYSFFSIDTNFIYSFVPNFSEPFYFRMLNTYSIKSDLTSNTKKEGFYSALNTLLIYGQNIDKSANLFLATGLLSNSPNNRDLSREIFIQGVNEQRLNPILLGQNLGKLLSGNYAPIERLSDFFILLQNISPLVDSALILLLENMVVQFPKLPPKRFNKLLEPYNELLLKYNKTPPIFLLDKIEEWLKIDSLKKQIQKMKGLFLSKQNR